MKRLAIGLVAAMTVVAGAGHAQVPDRGAPFTLASADEWMRDYYLTGDPARIPAYLDFIATDARVRAKNDPYGVSGFLAVVFEDNRDQVRGWLTGRTFDGPAREAVSLALAYAGRKDLLRDLDPALAEKTHASPTQLDRLKVADSAMVEDTLWGAFLASGRTAYVKPIVAELDDSRPSKGDPRIDRATRAAALWSLGANMRDHDRVYRLVRDEDAQADGPVKTALDTLLADYDRKRIRLPRQNGDFSANLAVVARDELAQFDSAPDHPVRLHMLAAIKPGGTAAVKITFTGMALTGTGDADVTYDLHVTGPDGKVMFERNDMAGFKGRLTATDNRVYDNKAVLTWSPDAPGIYRIDAVLHDNVHRADIALHTQVEAKN